MIFLMGFGSLGYAAEAGIKVGRNAMLSPLDSQLQPGVSISPEFMFGTNIQYGPWFDFSLYNGTYYEMQAEMGPPPYIQGDTQTLTLGGRLGSKIVLVPNVHLRPQLGIGVLRAPLLMDEAYYQDEVVQGAWNGIDSGIHNAIHPGAEAVVEVSSTALSALPELGLQVGGGYFLDFSSYYSIKLTVRPHPNPQTFTDYQKKEAEAASVQFKESRSSNDFSSALDETDSQTSSSTEFGIGKDGISISKTTETWVKLAAPPDKVSLKKLGISGSGIHSPYVNMVSGMGLFGVRSLNPKGDFPGAEGGKRNCFDVDIMLSGGGSFGDFGAIGYFNALGSLGYTYLRLNPQDPNTIDLEKKAKRNGFGFNLGLGGGVAGVNGSVTPIILPKIGFEFPAYNYGTASYRSKTVSFMVLPIAGLSWSFSYVQSF